MLYVHLHLASEVFIFHCSQSTLDILRRWRLGLPQTDGSIYVYAMRGVKEELSRPITAANCCDRWRQVTREWCISFVGQKLVCCCFVIFS